MMQVNDATIELIKEHEGIRLKAYRDPVGVWTIGYGHAETSGLHPIPVSGMEISMTEADEILRRDLDVFCDGLVRLIKVPVTQNQFGAMLSLAFNIGLTKFAKSTALRRLNAGDVAGAAEALTWFNKGGGRVLPGLVRRREAERRLMLSDDVMIPRGSITGGEAKAAHESQTNWLGGGVIATAAAMISDLRAYLPDFDEVLPWLLLAIGVYIIYNRERERRRGEH